MKHPRFRIQITFLGKLFFLINLGIGFAALNTGNNLLYLVFGAMLSFLILSGILSNNTLTNLGISAKLPPEIFAEEETTITVHFENKKKWLPSYSLTCFPKNTSLLLKTFHPIFEEIIPPRSAKNSELVLSFNQRGLVSLPDFQVETSYPFGLLKKYITVQSSKTALVFPKVFELLDGMELASLARGHTLTVTQAASSSNPYGIREFRLGDSYRYVHWKTSAKRGSLHIKEFEGEQKPFLFLQLVIDPAATSPQVCEETISLAASLLKHHIDRDYLVHLYSNQSLLENVSKSRISEGYSQLALTDVKNNPRVTPLHLRQPWIIVSNTAISEAGAHVVTLEDFKRPA